MAAKNKLAVLCTNLKTWCIACIIVFLYYFLLFFIYYFIIIYIYIYLFFLPCDQETPLLVGSYRSVPPRTNSGSSSCSFVTQTKTLYHSTIRTRDLLLIRKAGRFFMLPPVVFDGTKSNIHKPTTCMSSEVCLFSFCHPVFSSFASAKRNILDALFWKRLLSCPSTSQWCEVFVQQGLSKTPNKLHVYALQHNELLMSEQLKRVRSGERDMDNDLKAEKNTAKLACNTARARSQLLRRLFMFYSTHTKDFPPSAFALFPK